jgi:hypothetical protein
MSDKLRKFLEQQGIDHSDACVEQHRAGDILAKIKQRQQASNPQRTTPTSTEILAKIRFEKAQELTQKFLYSLDLK